MQGSARILAECHVLGLQIWNRLLFQVRIYIGVAIDQDKPDKQGETGLNFQLAITLAIVHLNTR